MRRREYKYVNKFFKKTSGTTGVLLIMLITSIVVGFFTTVNLLFLMVMFICGYLIGVKTSFQDISSQAEDEKGFSRFRKFLLRYKGD